jgi:hypothetical protein
MLVLPNARTFFLHLVKCPEMNVLRRPARKSRRGRIKNVLRKSRE